MNLQEEKEYVYSLMRDITQERQMLSKAYWELSERLNEINRLEALGFKELSTEGIVSLHNETKKIRAEKEIPKRLEAVKNFVEASVKREMDTGKEERKGIIPAPVIEEAKEKENKASTLKTGTLSREKATGAVIQALKEHGSPMSVGDLYEKVQEITGFKIRRQNFNNNIMYRAMQDNKKIKRAMRGYYQYEF